MKRKSIFKIILSAIVLALTFPVAFMFSACDQNPPKACEVVFVIDGRKEKSEEIALHSSLTPEQANELYNSSREGYTFDGWYNNADLSEPFEGVQDAGQRVVLYGTYHINHYTLTFVLDNGEPDIVEQLNYNQEIIAPTTPEKTGYTFVAWDNAVPSTMPAQDLTLTATWAVNSYSIRFVFGNGQEDHEELLDYGAEIVAPANPEKTGHTFVGWDSPVPSTMPADNLEFVAVWNINQYTITFDTAGGTEIASITQNYNTEIVAPANPEKTGHDFDGWDIPIPETMPAENMTITAIWVAHEHTLTFVLNNGEPNVVSSVSFGETIVAPTGLVKTGYSFDYWSPAVPTTMPDEDVTYTAVWAINQYTITYVLDNGEEDIEDTYDYGEEVEAPADPTQVGHTFGGWSPEVPTYMPAQDMTCTAIWHINSYTITFVLNNGEDNIVINNTYGAGYNKPENPTQEGYTFDGWDKEVPDAIPAEDMTITAQWSLNSHTVTYDMDGKLDNVVYTYDYGEATTPLGYTPTHEGYTFTGWEGALPEIMPDYDVVLRALWNVKQFSITYVLHNGEQDIVDPWNYDTVVVAPADPTREGYTFAGWSPAVPAHMPAENKIIDATWTANDITLTFDSNDGSAVNPITQPCDSAVSAPADPTRENYTFSGWYLDNGSFNNVFTFPNVMPKHDTILYAKWVDENDYRATFMVDGVQIAQDEYSVGDVIVAPADPSKAGFTFTGWSPAVPGTMPATDMTFVATWAKINYTITVLNSDSSLYGVEHYDTNDPITAPPAVDHAYYDFAGWQVIYGEGYWAPAAQAGYVLEPGDSTAGITDTVYGSFTLKATYTPTVYTITYAGVEGATNPNASITTYTIESATITLQDATKDGYMFEGWYVGDDKYTEIANGSHGNITLTAGWTLLTYYITYHLNGGTNGANPATYTVESAAITLQDATKDYYTFGGWYNNADLAPEHAVATIAQGSTGALDLYAKWTAASYTITWAGVEGATNPNLQNSYTVEDGTITLLDASKEGYTFVDWNDGTGVVTQIVCATRHANVTLTAEWTINTHSLTFNFANSNTDLGDQGDAQIVINDIEYNTEIDFEALGLTEEQIELLASPTKLGYNFSAWQDANEDELPDYMPDADLVFTATYEVDSNMSKFEFNGSKSKCEITSIKASEKATITEIYVPEYVTLIAKGAFALCPNVTLLDVPFIGESRTASTQSTGYCWYPFYYSKTTNPDETSYRTIKQNYYIPKKLKNLRLPANVVISQSQAFTYGATITTIENVYFKGTIENWCEMNFGVIGRNPMSLEETEHFYYLPSTSLDAMNLNNYVELIELTIPTSASGSEYSSGELRPLLFAGFASLEKVIMPVGAKKINSKTFANCTALTELIILETAFSRSKDGIASDSFDGCENLSFVYFAGTEDQWTALTTGTGAKIKDTTILNRIASEDCSIYFYLENPTTDQVAEEKYWHYDDNDEIEVWRP